MEFATFSTHECYVYTRIPPPDAAGHRANLWDVEHWTHEVSVKVLTRGDELSVKLLDKETGNLFAECPVPNCNPIQTAVEAVLDSSRYYVLCLVDAESRQRAFIGIGFRERETSTAFMAAITDHRHYLDKKARAEQMRQEYNQSAKQTSHVDYSLKPDEKIKIRLPNTTTRPRSQEHAQQDVASLPLPPSNDEEWGEFVGT